jgi:hypothetical protein|nr:MAG TPA: hypothetical protein [Caudoviricetes sp.]
MEENKNILQFDLSSKQIKFKNILNKEFVEMEIWAVSDIDPNRNKSHFTLESMERVVANGSIKNKPIVGFFKENDFTTHEGVADYDIELQNEYWNTERGERILGWVRESDPVEIVEKDGLHWIKFRCVLCVKYCYAQVKRLLKDRNKKVSVEITVHKSEKRPDGIVDLIEWDLNGTTILGSKNGKEVLEGIPGAHLSILEDLGGEAFAEQKKVLSFAYEKAFGASKDKSNEVEQISEEKTEELKLGTNSVGKEEEKLENEVIIDGVENFAKDDIGTKSALEVDKSKEAMSEKPWGEVDKSELRKRVIAAENFKSIADDIFLDLREGWEDGIEGALKYPVMCLEGEKAVYNRGGLASAKAYAEKNGDEKVAEKLEKIYKHLELEDGDMEKEAAEHCEFCEDYDCKTEEAVPLAEGQEEAPCECPDDNGELEMGGCENSEKEDCGEPEKLEEEHHCDDCGDDHKDDDDNDEDDCDEMCKLSKRCAELEAKCEEYCGTIAKMSEDFESKTSEYEAEIAKYSDYAEIKERMEKAEAKLYEQFCLELKAYAESIMANEKIEKSDRDAVIEKCVSGKYSTKEEIFAEVAVAAFKTRTPAGERFSSAFEVPAMGAGKAEDKRPMSREERMKARVAKCGKK